MDDVKQRAATLDHLFLKHGWEPTDDDFRRPQTELDVIHDRLHESGSNHRPVSNRGPNIMGVTR